MIGTGRQHDSIRNKSRFRRGTIVVLTAAMIVAFLATVVLSVDVAYMQLTKVKLRSATDAAARAAGESLSREQDLAAARQAARISRRRWLTTDGEALACMPLRCWRSDSSI